MNRYEEWGLPQPEEAARYVRHDALHVARRNMGRFSVAHTQGRVMTAGRGTKLHSRIVLREDGRLIAEPEAMDAPVRGQHPMALQRQIQDQVRSAARNDILQRLRSVIGRPRDTLLGEIEHLLREPQVEREVEMATEEAAAPIVRNAARDWDHALGALVGPREARLALNTFGWNARLQDIEQARLPNVREARRTSPNATLLWSLGRDPDESPSPQAIHRQARRIFQNEIGKISSSAALLPEEPAAWESFLALNPRTAAMFPNRPELVLLAITCTRSGAKPSHPAASALMGLHLGPSMVHPIIAASFLRESQEATRERQEKLNRQLRHIAWNHPQGRDPHDPGRNNAAFDAMAASFISMNDPLPWPQILERFPPIPEKAGTPSPRRTRRRKSLTAQDALQVLEGPAGEELLRNAGRTLQLQHSPGQETVLHHQGAPIIRVRRSPEGFLSCRSHGTWTENLHVPSPRGENPAWSTRGLGMKAALEAGERTLQDSLLRNESLSPKRAREAVIMFLDRNMMNPDRYASSSLLTAVQSLVNPQAWHLAKEQGEPVTWDRYNAAVGAIPHLKHLAATNPGALEWALAYAQPTEPVRHPGQIITLARNSMLQAGLDPALWRRTTSLPRKTVRSITGQASPRGAAQVLDTIARSGAVPHRSILRKALEDIIQDQRATRRGDDRTTCRMRVEIQVQLDPDRPPQPENPGPELRLRNRQRFLELLFRESAPREQSWNPGESQEALSDRIPNTRDYVDNRTNRNIRVNSTTWKGLERAAAAWHQDLVRDGNRHRWERTLDRNQGNYLAWSCPIEETEIDGITLTPLRDEWELEQESREMLHCVAAYGDACARGDSVILSITENGQRIATGEIARTPRGWEVRQTATRRNHQAPERIAQAVREAAEQCNSRGRNLRQTPPTTSWLVDAGTGEPVETGRAT